jgi:hypothetical protein
MFICWLFFLYKSLVEILLDHRNELATYRHDISSLEGAIVLSGDIDLELWSLGISWDKYPDIRVASFTDTVHDTTHHGDMERTEVTPLSCGHPPTSGETRNLGVYGSHCLPTCGEGDHRVVVGFLRTILLLPLWHLGTYSLVHILGEYLELVGTGTPAPRTADDLRSKCSKSHRLQYISTDLYLQ